MPPANLSDELEAILVPGLVSVWHSVQQDVGVVRKATLRLRGLSHIPPAEAARVLAEAAEEIRRERLRAAKMLQDYAELRSMLARGVLGIDAEHAAVPDIALTGVPGVAREYTDALQAAMVHAGFSPES